MLATANKDKIEELKPMFVNLGMEVLSTYDFPDLEEVVEDADTLAGNALKKARYIHKMTGLPALSDDTGLEVEVLNGAPGVYSARYAGEHATYADNVDKLLAEMTGKSDRKAHFKTVAALVTGAGEYTFEGMCDGEILHERAGSSGFGYDPVFKPAGFDKSFAELSLQTKNEISHRGRAVQKVLQFLENRL